MTFIKNMCAAKYKISTVTKAVKIIKTYPVIPMIIGQTKVLAVQLGYQNKIISLLLLPYETSLKHKMFSFVHVHIDGTFK